MFPSVKLSRFSDGMRRRQLHLIGRSRKTLLFTRHITCMVGRCLKAETLEKAVELFEKAQQVRPDDYESHTLRAQALTELGREDEARHVNQVAVECIEKHLELNPDEARAYSLGASLLIRLGQNERSKQWTQQAMTLAPADPLVLYNAACNWALLGETGSCSMDSNAHLSRCCGREIGLSTTPISRGLRGHPRFQAIVRRIAPS